MCVNGPFGSVCIRGVGPGHLPQVVTVSLCIGPAERQGRQKRDGVGRHDAHASRGGARLTRPRALMAIEMDDTGLHFHDRESLPAPNDNETN